MVGVPVAVALGAGFVPARKPGKLPRKTVSESYELDMERILSRSMPMPLPLKIPC